MRVSLFLFCLLLTSCITPGRLSKLPTDIHIVEKRETIKEYKTGNDTLTVQYFGAHGYEIGKEESSTINETLKH